MGGHWISLVKQKRRVALKPDQWKDASAWTAQFWKRIVFETGRSAGNWGPEAGTVQEKRRRSRHANDVMGQELRCADAQPGPLWRQIADVFV
jgi:hypothetical protein